MNLERLGADSALRGPPCENGAMQPTPDEVHAALERVLASSSFASANRLSRFLRFIVERSLAGQAERLKEYVIGVEVFDRDERYDPRIDSIVRVEAGRLRAKLDEYYRGAGGGDLVAIRLGKGGYAPYFERRSDAKRDVGAAASPQPHRASVVLRAPPRRRIAMAVAGVAIVAALAIGVTAWRGTYRDVGEPQRVVAVLPFATYSADADARMLAMRLTDAVTAELVRLGRFSVVASSAARPFADSRAPPRDIARELHADLLLQARVNAQDGELKVAAIVVDGARDRKLWADSVTGDPANLDDLAHRVAMAVAGSQLSAPP
jgi:TolB-like protein